MDMMNSIASASMTMSTAKVMQEVSLSVTKKTMDAQEQAAAQLIEQFQSVNPPHLGQNIDVRA